jgi:hypothetical protein
MYYPFVTRMYSIPLSNCALKLCQGNGVAGSSHCKHYAELKSIPRRALIATVAVGPVRCVSSSSAKVAAVVNLSNRALHIRFITQQQQQ